ncbi:MAG: hypothetical protein QNJ44_13315 [Rhodobacter sp.]|nr:hypothetical protein [Rhodobacter sp.]
MSPGHSLKNSGHPLDQSIKDRLQLGADAGLSLWLVRAVIQAGDAISRISTGKPFFALRETEALVKELDGLKGRDLTHALLGKNNGTRITPHGLDHVPTEGPALIASTHATGLFDFIAHADSLMDKRPDLKVVANEDAERFLGSDLIVPVKINRQRRARAGPRIRRVMVEHLEGGGALLIFGSGRVPHRQNGYLVEPDWRSGPTRISAACGVPVIPAALNAQNSDAYYRTRRLAYRLSRGNDDFAAMIASLRHAQELRDKLGGCYEVFYGAPLPPGTQACDLKAQAERLVPGLYGPNG